MQIKKDRRGFTMAELLVVVAIIVILGGVGVIAVQRHQRSLAQMERNDVAKEIFVAAQNHLTMAEGQGYSGDPETISFGTSISEPNREYYIVFDNNTVKYDGTTILDQMLPFGAIDETVRAGGRYLIHYRTRPATVLDVFYWTPSGRFGGSASVTSLVDKFGTGLTTNDKKGSVLLGWYGGDESVEMGSRILNPSIEVENAERLVATVTYPGTDLPAMKLLITSKDDDGKVKAMAAILVSYPGKSGNDRVTYLGDNRFSVILDDITDSKSLHFADLNELSNNDWFSSQNASGAGTSESLFSPGEDITVKAVAYRNDEYTNIAYSNEWTVNSLFAEVTNESIIGDDGEDTGLFRKVALISNMRHLENLDKRVSGLDFGIVEAKQTADLIWADASDSSAFTACIAEAKEVDASKVRVYMLEDSSGTEEGCFLPVNLDYALEYDGLAAGDDEAGTAARCYGVKGVKVNYATSGSADSGAAGLFGAISQPLTLSNLELVDFEVTGSGNTGALAGELAEGSVITNVVAYNTRAFDEAHSAATIVSTGTDGSAGGLIGRMEGGTVQKCAAALLVQSLGGDAGGLVGTAEAGTVTASFSGGHTDGGQYATGKYDGKYNVTASANAGGLIGAAGDAEIERCYSTCSAKGATAGGLVGTASGDIAGSYATGLVTDGTTEGASAGAFAGSLNGASLSNCLYYGIVNNGRYAVGGDTAETARTGVAAMDDDTESFIDFIETSAPVKLTWLPKKDEQRDAAYSDADDDVCASNYDTSLNASYASANKDASNNALAMFILRTVNQLGASVNDTATALAPADFVRTHYGDWPSPEILVLNTK